MGKTDPMFKVGDGASGMYFHPEYGTVLDPHGEVVAVSKRDDGRFDVTVKFNAMVEHTETYLVEKSGRCDYLQKTVDFTPHEK